MGDGPADDVGIRFGTFEAAFADAAKRALQYSWGCPRGWGVVFGRRGCSARERRVPPGQTEAACDEMLTQLSDYYERKSSGRNFMSRLPLEERRTHGG